MVNNHCLDLKIENNDPEDIASREGSGGALQRS